MSPFLVETIDTESALSALEPEWRALELSSGNALPFFTFDWAACWWEHLREHSLTLVDSLAVRAVRTPAGRLVGVAPLILTQRPGVGPLRARCLQFMGADPNLTEIRGMLCEPGLAPDVYAALHADLVRSLQGLDWVRWTGIDERHGARGVLGEVGLRWGDGVSCYVLDLLPTWEELRASRTSNLREALRKCYRSLQREGISFSFEAVTEPGGVEPAVNDFFRLHAERASLENTVHHGDVFAMAACRAFLLDACGRFAARGALRIFRLSLDGQLAATRIGFVLGGSLYLYYSGVDPASARHGVGTVLVAEAMKRAIDERLRSVNLSTGSDRSKLRWRPREVAFREALLVSPRALGLAKYEALSAVQRAVVGSPLGGSARRLLGRHGA